MAFSYRDGNCYFVSYRDPNLGQTIEVYQEAAQFLADYQGSERTLTQYVIGTFSFMDVPPPGNNPVPSETQEKPYAKTEKVSRRKNRGTPPWVRPGLFWFRLTILLPGRES